MRNFTSNRDEDRELEKYEMVRNMVRSKLQETGNLDRLRSYVQKRLTAAGWKGDMIRELRVAVNEIGVCNLTVEKLYERIANHGRQNIDKRLEEEALKKIKHSYKNALDKGGRELEQNQHMYNSDCIIKIRYNNRSRK